MWIDSREDSAKADDTGFRALCGIAAFYRLAADPAQLRRELAIVDRAVGDKDLLQAAKIIGLRARVIPMTPARLTTVPTPAILPTRAGGYLAFGGKTPAGFWRTIDPITHVAEDMTLDALLLIVEPRILLVARAFAGPGIDPRGFGFRWFLPSIWRYRKPLGHVLVASLFVQVFALIAPLFFQVVIDKVLTHQSYSTLFVLVGGLVIIGFFDLALQYLRTYALSHTAIRIDVELGRRLFRHLLALPVSYFESRPTGQTVARVRELETIRTFLTGQGLFAALDLLFTFVFLAVLFAYSWKLTLIVLATIPLYVLVAFLDGPLLRDRLAGEIHAQRGKPAVSGRNHRRYPDDQASAVEPVMAATWEERLANYVRSSFRTTMLRAKGQNSIQYINKLSSAALLLFGAKAVI